MVRLRPWSRPGRRAQRSRGQAIVEFTLVAPMLFLLILGTIEAGRFFFYELLNNATREGARYAIVHGGAFKGCSSGPAAPGTQACDVTGDNIKAEVQKAAMNIVAMGNLFLYDPVWTSRGDLTELYPGDASTGTNDRGEYVTVFVDFTYRPIVAEVVDVDVLPDLKISAESTLVINH